MQKCVLNGYYLVSKIDLVNYYRIHYSYIKEKHMKLLILIILTLTFTSCNNGENQDHKEAVSNFDKICIEGYVFL